MPPAVPGDPRWAYEERTVQALSFGDLAQQPQPAGSAAVRPRQPARRAFGVFESGCDPAISPGHVRKTIPRSSAIASRLRWLFWRMRDLGPKAVENLHHFSLPPARTCLHSECHLTNKVNRLHGGVARTRRSRLPPSKSSSPTWRPAPAGRAAFRASAPGHGAIPHPQHLRALAPNACSRAQPIDRTSMRCGRREHWTRGRMRRRMGLRAAALRSARAR